MPQVFPMNWALLYSLFTVLFVATIAKVHFTKF